jgi:hypothetical protein
VRRFWSSGNLVGRVREVIVLIEWAIVGDIGYAGAELASEQMAKAAVHGVGAIPPAGERGENSVHLALASGYALPPQEGRPMQVRPNETTPALSEARPASRRAASKQAAAQV